MLHWFLLAAAACFSGDDATSRSIPYPKMVLDADTLELGSVELDETVTGTVLLSNEGSRAEDGARIGMRMGVGSKDADHEGIEIGPGYSGVFSVTWDETTILCPDDGEVVTANRATAKGDTGGGGGGTGIGSGGTGTGDTGKDEESKSDALFTLGPGCSIPLTVTATGAYEGDLWGSLVVESVQADQTEEEEANNELPAYLRDPIRFRQIAYLHAGAPDATPPLDSEPIVIGYPRPSQHACLEGETPTIEALAVDPDGQALDYEWVPDKRDETSPFEDLTGPVVRFTCPELEAESAGKYVTVTVLIKDPDRHEVWSQDRITVYPASTPLYDEYTEILDESTETL
ncbi:hypothetical protein LBMAG42_18450 [Deltaproteobacteria bacterium]|nr:hypothetical protein LBMAG42_18450 [Deltaproteobacteria bacterium]